MLAHSPSQEHNQSRLENYLSVSSQPNLDISAHLNGRSHSSGEYRRQSAHRDGTDTPRDLNSRVKILELYTLHVLPRNQEWQYAREFITMSEVLDEERREAFLQMLQTLEDQAKDDQNHEARLLQERDEQLERERREAEDRRMAESRLEDERSLKSQSSKGHERSKSEVDYGIEDPLPGKPTKKVNGVKATKPAQSDGIRPTASTSKTPARPKKKAPQTVIQRAGAMITNLQRLLLDMAQSMSKNPTILMRNILFLLAFIIAFARQDVRQRLSRITGAGWDKLKRTVGMGVKVSYI